MAHPSTTSDHAIGRSFDVRLRPVGLVQEAKFSGRYSPAYAAQADGLMAMYDLPTELVDMIFEAADLIVWTEIPGTRVFTLVSCFMRRVSHNYKVASTPPADGSCPFIDKLPAEIRRKILIDELDVLPSRDMPIYPVCGKGNGGPSQPRQAPNALVDMMLLSKKIRNEIAEVVYEERTFAIHVHPGFQNAGIEFLHVGRQPLQYLDHIGDGRFTKFCTGEMFGFCRLKKIEVHMFPDDGAYQHSAINTYFMNIALVRLLTLNSDRNVDRITSIRIVFPPACKHSIDNTWWDTGKDRPRETRIHGISDVELVLRPFALLTRVHQVDVQLPDQVDGHVRSVKFAESLVHCMTVTTLQGTFNSDALEMKIESARFALEDHIRRKLFGNGHYVQIPKITGEELEDDKQSQGPDDDDDDENYDDMEISPEDDPFEDQQGSDMDEDHPEPASNGAIEYAAFDEDGGFPEDLDSFSGDMDVAPNALSEKVARFVECFSVTGDTARIYLELCGDDLERACQLFIDMPDVNEAAASKRPASYYPNVHAESFQPGGGSGGPSSSGEVDRKSKGKSEGENKKGKQRAYFVDDDGDDDDKSGTYKQDDDSDDDDDDDDDNPSGSLSNNRFHVLRASQTNTQQQSGEGTWQEYDPQNWLHLGLQGRRFQLNRQRRHRLMMGAQDRLALPSTSGVNEDDRGRPAERGSSRVASDTTTTTLSNNVRGVARPSVTTARRDSSTGLAANYSEDGQRISEYRSHESRRSTTTRPQMAVQRLRYLEGVGYFEQDSPENWGTSNDNSSPSHQSGEHIEFASSSRLPNAFGDQQSQTDGFMNGNYTFAATQSNYHGLPVNSFGQTAYDTARLAGLDLPFDPAIVQYSSMTGSSTAAQLTGQWNGGNFYQRCNSNTSVPIAGAYPPSYISAPSLGDDWGQMVAQELNNVAPVTPGSMPDANRQATTQPFWQPPTPNTNYTAAPPSLQHSGLSSNLEDMDVDATEDDSPEAPGHTKHKQDGDF
ncbi:hypothetical protein Q7P35_006055 [Cladosporium inversicolor]